MQRIFVSITIFALLFLVFSVMPTEAKTPRSKPLPGTERYIIAYQSGDLAALKALIKANGGRTVLVYKTLAGVAADLSPAGLKAVRTSGLAREIIKDEMRKLDAHLPDFSVQFIPWGVDRIHAPEAWATTRGAGALACVMDTGMDMTHPDLDDNVISPLPGGILDFIDFDNDPTDAVLNGHGTSTAGVIAAEDNAFGVIGVAPEATILPYRVCAVGGCPLSAIFGAIDRSASDGCDVMNMSLSGSAPSLFESALLAQANRGGVVLVGSAGNQNQNKPRFPAGYDIVLAVAATDENDNRASFSNFGGWVDITGPGVDVPTTTHQGVGRDAFVHENSPHTLDHNPNPMSFSALDDVTADLVDVGLALSTSVCNGGICVGKIALIQRGSATFASKVANVAAGGAIGAIIYNNAPGNFNGTLGSLSAIPAVSLSQAEGQHLVADVASGPTNVRLQVIATDYTVISGTSFSAPHVSGVAALIRSVNPGLTPIQVRDIIEKTAEDLGGNPNSNAFGSGMVRADYAVDAAD